MRLTNYRFDLTNSLERLLDSKEQVASVKEDLKFARRYLNVLVYRLNKEIEEKTKDDEATSNYDSPNWALLQAERLGYRRAIRKVLEILRPIEESND